MKSEKKILNILQSNYTGFTFYNSWITICFHKMLVDFRITYNGNNVMLKHIQIPPLLTILMKKLIETFNSYPLKNGNEDTQEILLILDNLSCFFEKLYEFQVENIGKLDMVLLEKHIIETCLSSFEVKKVIEFYIYIKEKNKLKLDTTEHYTNLMNKMLKINFMWYKTETFLSHNLDICQNLWIKICKTDVMTHNEAILATINILANKASSETV